MNTHMDSLTQFLDSRYVVEFNGGDEWDNRVTTAMQTWQVLRRLLREADKIGAEYARRVWGRK